MARFVWCIAGLLAFALPEPVAVPPAVDFLAPRDHAFPAEPRAVLIEDFNSDARPDLAIATAGNDSVAIIINGATEPHSFVPVGTRPVAIAAGDFNRDSRPDVAVANQGSSDVSMLLGRGDGTFDPARSFPVGPEPASIAAADIDADGASDLVVRDDSAISVLLGNGDGTLQAGMLVGDGLWSFSIGDFNNDAKADIVAGVAPDPGPGRIAVLLGNGNGTFQPPIYTPVDEAPEVDADAVASGDFDGDGRLDAVIETSDHDLKVLLGNGDGMFAAATSFPNLAVGSAFAVADFNRDSRLDLAATRNNQVLVLIGTGDGGFQPPFTVWLAANSSIAVGDLNGDLKLDLVGVAGRNLSGSRTYSGVLSVRAGKGDGTFYATPGLQTGAAAISTRTADFNGDGNVDLVLGLGSPGRIAVALGNGDGSFRPLAAVTSLPTVPYAVAVGDFDGDSRADMIAGGPYYPNILFFAGNGDGTFRPAQVIATGLGAENLEVADVNHDSTLDAVAVSDSGTVSFLAGNGDGTFEAPVDLLEGAIYPSALILSDFNGDSHADLGVGHSIWPGPRFSVLLGNGDGTFQPPITSNIGTSIRFLVAADFNADMRPDIAAVARPSGVTGTATMFVAMGNGDGTIGPRVRYFTPVQPKSIVVADFDRDQKADLGVLGGAALWILRGAGDGTFSFEPTGFSALETYDAHPMAVADFNGDGRPDVAVAGDGRFEAHGPSATGAAILLNISRPVSVR